MTLFKGGLHAGIRARGLLLFREAALARCRLAERQVHTCEEKAEHSLLSELYCLIQWFETLKHGLIYPPNPILIYSGPYCKGRT